MKKFPAIVIAGSLALTAGAQGQQSDDHRTSKKERPQGHETPTEQQPRSNPQPARSIARPHLAPRTYPPAFIRPYPQQRFPPVSVARPRPERNAQNQGVMEDPTAAPAPLADKESAPVPNAPQAQRHDRRVRLSPGNRPDVQKIKAQHANFHAQPKPEQVPPVDFDENRRISGSEHWEGEKYEAFRNYHPHRHNRDWYHRHHRLVILICGGYYYWDNFYWYPAWGYDPLASYYVYDGPIYSGPAVESPDQVIADVQATLQDLGYYDGEVDGILGPSTQDALAAYQADNGLYDTAAIDQATLASLGFG
jgi:putative peptidoglycan binding protein